MNVRERVFIVLSLSDRQMNAFCLTRCRAFRENVRPANVEKIIGTADSQVLRKS